MIQWLISTKVEIIRKNPKAMLEMNNTNKDEVYDGLFSRLNSVVERIA